MKNTFSVQQFLIIVATALISAALAILVYSWFDKPETIYLPEQQLQPRAVKVFNTELLDTVGELITLPEMDFVEVSSISTPAVVSIQVTPYKFEFWSSTSSGSGVIISPDGYIITNNHVVEQNGKITVTMNDRREYEAKKMGVDPTTDLALLKIDVLNLPWLKIGNSDSLKVGEWVLAVGNPFNLSSTVTIGIVSAKGRNIDILDERYKVESFIQTDARVNPGNSGGALVNLKGELVGINTAIMTSSEHFEGYSFAIPSNLVRKVMDDLRDYGAVQRGVLGIEIKQVDDLIAKRVGLKTVEGIYITELMAGGAAALAGLRKGDVILGVDNVRTRTTPELQEQVARHSPNDKMRIEYFRKGKTKIAEVTLQKKSVSSIAEEDEFLETPDVLEKVGFELRELLPTERRKLSIEDGVKVLSIYKNSTIEATNMDIGFIVRKVNGETVTTVEEVMVALELGGNEITLEGIYEKYTGEYVYKFSSGD